MEISIIHALVLVVTFTSGLARSKENASTFTTWRRAKHHKMLNFLFKFQTKIQKVFRYGQLPAQILQIFAQLSGIAPDHMFSRPLNTFQVARAMEEKSR